jgi:hypothetical protein
MDIVKTIILFLIAFSFTVANCFAASELPDPDSLPKCKGKTCFVKARPEPWPQEPVKDGIKVKYRFVRLLVPEQIDYVGIGEAVAVIDYGRSKRIVLGSMTNNDLNLPESDISVVESIDVMFNKTPDDKEPDSIKNKLAWRTIMLAKEQILRKVTKVSTFEKDKIKVFCLSRQGEPYKNVAYIINAKYGDYAVTFESNIDTDEFLKIIASM